MNWKKATWTLVAILPVLALFAWGMTRDPREIPSPLPGKPAPEFTLAVIPTDVPEGAPEPAWKDTVRLADQRGKIVVVNYYASWCLACRDEHPQINQVAQSYAGKPVEFYGILYKDSAPNIRRWIAEMGGQVYPTLSDPSARTAIDYGLYGVPETFFIGPDGKVVKKHTGPVNAAALTRTIDSLLKTMPASGPNGSDTPRGVPLPAQDAAAHGGAF
ncbi:MAG: TlpA family protein disulfide reductase [Gemmatimonadaceae bacterium]